MHYIKLLRPATIDTSNPDDPVLSMLLTITTDLGESFLYTDDPVELIFFRTIDGPMSFNAMSLTHKPLFPVGPKRPILWKAGMRVLDVKLHFDKQALNHKSHVLISARETGSQMISLSETRDLLPWRVAEDGRENEGLIANLTVEFDKGVFSASLRELACQHDRDELSAVHLRIEEDIGDSIARHVWDGGLVTAALLADTCRTKQKGFYIRDYMPIDNESPNVLELGCGVGIVGITIASIITRAIKQQGIEPARPTVLLTDLPDAEERARSNISRYSNHTARTPLYRSYRGTDVQYENLDWDDGRHSRFGPLVKSRYWDFIVLSECVYNVDGFPSLVGTLTALHALNVTNSRPEAENGTATKLIISTKPRHDSERALFELLRADGWTQLYQKDLLLPKLNDADEMVEIYLLEKQSGPTPQSSRKRKGTDAIVDNPSKKSTPTTSK